MTKDELQALQSKAPALKEKIEIKNREVAKRISEAYSEATRALSNALGHTLCAGLMMIERKEDLPHGEFGPWIEKYCPNIPHRTATRFMEATRSAVAAVLGDEFAKGEISERLKFDGAPLYEILNVDPAKLNKASREVQNRFAEFLQGKTQHQLLLDWKEIKERSKEKTPAPKPTAKELAEAEVRQANDDCDSVMVLVRQMILSGRTLQNADDNKRKELLETLVEATGLIREVIGEARASRKSKKD